MSSRLLHLRHIHRQTRDEAAKILQVSTPTLKGYEKGRSEPRSSLLAELGKVYGTEWLLYVLGLQDAVPEPISALKGTSTKQYLVSAYIPPITR